MHSVSIDIAADHPAFAGHFPDRALLPGVALLAEVLEAAGAEPVLRERLGATPRIAHVKFLSPVLPGARLRLTLQPLDHGMRFTVHEGERLVATGLFDAVPS